LRSKFDLKEIEKTEDPKTLWSLLMPWELGRCAFEAGARHIDVKNVIWLGTSNIGHDLVFQHRDSRKNSEEPMSREEYVELMALLRPKVSERLGVRVLRFFAVTTLLSNVNWTGFCFVKNNDGTSLRTFYAGGKEGDLLRSTIYPRRRVLGGVVARDDRGCD